MRVLPALLLAACSAAVPVIASTRSAPRRTGSSPASVRKLRETPRSSRGGESLALRFTLCSSGLRPRGAPRPQRYSFRNASTGSVFAARQLG